MTLKDLNDIAKANNLPEDVKLIYASGEYGYGELHTLSVDTMMFVEHPKYDGGTYSQPDEAKRRTIELEHARKRLKQNRAKGSIPYIEASIKRLEEAPEYPCIIIEGHA